MKKLIVLSFISVMLSSPGLAQAAKSKCKIAQDSVDPATGQRIVRSKWDALVTVVMGGESEAYGSVSVFSRGEQNYLRVKLNAMDYYTLPEQFAQHEDPTWDPAHRDFLDSLLGDVVFFPAGASVRLDLDDRSALFLKSANNIRVRTNYALPGQELGARESEQKVAKLFGGLLAKAVGGEVESHSDVSPHYTVTLNVDLEYPIDAKSEDILNRAAVTSMRIESRDRYYTLGWRSTKDQMFSWNKKSYYKIRDALQCVNTVTGRGAS